MPAQIRPTRLDVTDRFPMVAFRIHADGGTKLAEVAIGADPALFTPEGARNRTAANFYSTKGNGAVRFAGDEASFTVPPEVLARFIGNEKLYYGLATAGEGGAMKVAVAPTAESPFIKITGLSGRSMARVRVLPNRQQRAAGYGGNGQAQLEWAGDAAMPGMTPVADGAAPATAANGAAPAAANGNAAVSVPYDDGFGPLPTPADMAPEATSVPAPQAQGYAGQRSRGLASDIDPESRGIEGPARSQESAASMLQARGLAAPNRDYDGASRFAASPAFDIGRAGTAIDRIVIHITDASTTSSTVSHFTRADADSSAHYLVAQDGEIIQFVAEADTAWHARGANRRSIGIEHVAIKAGGVDYPRADGTKQHFDALAPTDIQYCESAALVSSLCDTYGLTPDRTTIVGHREADTKTSHTSCPDGNWNWDHFMDLVTTRYCAAQPQSPAYSLAHGAALGAATAWTVNWDEVELIPQPTNFSCWAAAGAMLIGWRDRVSLTPETIGSICSRATTAGLDPAQVTTFGDELGLLAEPPVSYSVEGFRDLIATQGPLWIAEALPGTLHAIIVTGIYSDGTTTYVRIADPWDRAVGAPGAPGAYANTHTTGSRYIMRYEDFHAQYEAAINGDPPNRQVLHSGNPNGLVPNSGQTVPPPGYAMSADDMVKDLSPAKDAVLLPAPPAPRARAMSGAEAAIAIGGFLLETIRDSSGDVTWEVDQFRERKHPNDVAPATPPTYQDAPTIRLDQWPVSGGLADDISAWFAIDWQYGGTSLGNVRITNIGTNDAIGWSLHVRAQIMDDNILYPPNDCAALRVRLHYRFSRGIGSDWIAITDVHLYGDGTHEVASHWVQTETLAPGDGTPIRANAMTGLETAAAIAQLGGTALQLVGGQAISSPSWLQTWHPDGVAPAGAREWRQQRASLKNTPWATGPLDRMTAGFQVTWEHDGRSIRNIFFFPSVNTALLNDIEVSVHVIPRPALASNAFVPLSPLVATIDLQFNYRFIHKIDDDENAIHRMKIYGDGGVWQNEEPEWIDINRGDTFGLPLPGRRG